MKWSKPKIDIMKNKPYKNAFLYFQKYGLLRCTIIWFIIQFSALASPNKIATSVLKINPFQFWKNVYIE